VMGTPAASESMIGDDAMSMPSRVGGVNYTVVIRPFGLMT
jgi:hypothetical protein